jgi:cytochrome bd-type quinol oxidase subunit 2
VANLVRAANDPDCSLTIYGAASNPPTLNRMLVIAAIRIHLFLTYSAIVN